MRDSNHRSIIANRAAVTISTTLYDRRALDCTSDKPLVNSLNHLTFLASSSGKVRETLSNDGGLERLVDILYECKLDEKNQTMDENPLVAWKWSLAFQCLVLVGTRGTEAIRKKVVDAGMIPVIATVLDNYLAINANNAASSSFGRQYALSGDRFQDSAESIHNSFQASSSENRDDVEDHGNELLDAEAPNQDSTVSVTSSTGTSNTLAATSAPDEMMKGLSQSKRKNRQHTWPNHIEQLKEKIELMQNIIHLTSSNNYDDSDADDISTNKLLIDFIEEKNFALDATKGKHAKYKKNRRQLLDVAAPRNFINGILVPRDDDVLWSLQLLAFISKYSYLKSILSETSIISGMSLRSPPQEDLLSFNGNFSNSVPALENDDNDNDNELEEVRSVDNDKKDDHDEIMIDTEGSNNNSTQDVSENDSTGERLLANKFDLMLPLSMKIDMNDNKSSLPSVVCAESSNLEKLKKALDQLEYNEDRLSKAKKFIKLSKILNKDLKHESLKVKEFKIRHNKLEFNYLKSKWNYKFYPFFDNLNEDQDLSIKPLQILNIFPLVEKFTVKASHSKEIHYWAGVIMRNSCRRDESKGGVRQCACFDCGKWEEYPRQFAKCRRCKRTKYCSKECQSTLWEYHRHWCVQTSSSSSAAPGGPSISAAPMSNVGGVLNDTAVRQFAPQPPQQQQQNQQDNESINSSLNTTTTAGLMRHQFQQQPLMGAPLGSFVSPAQLNLTNDQPLTRATTPQMVSNTTPILAPTNSRGINFGTILFHNAVHATLAATNNNNNNNNNINNNNNNINNTNTINTREDATIRSSFNGFGSVNINSNNINFFNSNNNNNNNNNNNYNNNTNNNNDSSRSDSDN